MLYFRTITACCLGLVMMAVMGPTTCTAADLVVRYTPLEDPSDKRLEFPLSIVTLALEKTRARYGGYQTAQVPQALSLARTVYELKRDTYPNYFFPGGLNIEQLGSENLLSLDFPVDMGLLSYRICFISPAAKANVKQVKTLDDLRQFTIVQGTHWPDVPILRKNGFQVKEVGNYPGLFKTVISNRADLFCRGISELKREYTEYKNLGELTYDESFVLAYPLRYALYFNKNSQPLITRLEEGLAIAHRDGSLKALFIKQYREDILFAKLKQRRIFYLQGEDPATFSDNYKSYLIDPFTID